MKSVSLRLVSAATVSAAVALVGLAALSLAGCREDPIEPAWMVTEGLRGTAEDLATRCSDGEDNDLDGLFDCDDPDCAAAYHCAARGPEPLGDDPARCFDGVDNDEDGFVDCRDFSCLREGFCRTAERGDEASVEGCTDGLDNDWDDAIDCEDVDCMTLVGADICEASDSSCSDGVDNDKDGFVDCADWSCSQPEPGIIITVCD